MAKFTQWVQKKSTRKWVYVIGGLFLVILLFLMLRGRGAAAGSGASTVVQTGPDPQLATIAAQANVEQSAISANLAAQSIEANTALEMERLRSASEMLSTEANLAAFQTQIMGADRASEREYLVASQQVEAGRQVDLAGIGATRDVQIAAISGEVAQTNIAARTAQSIAAIEGQTALGIAREQGAVARAEINLQNQLHERDFHLKTYAINKAKKKHVSAIVAGESAQLGTKTRAITGAIGGIANAIFSDIRMKKNIQQTGERIDGVPMYTYEFVGAPGLQAGVMAQELALLNPNYVLHTKHGVAVDYIGLDAAA